MGAFEDSDFTGILLAEFRGGAASRKTSNNNIIRGAQVTLAKMTNFWKSTFTSLQNKVASLIKSKEQKKEEDLLDQLQSMPVKAVSVPQNSVLPPDIVRVAVKRSGLIGNPLRTDRVQEIARNLKRWYMKQGYILHTVTGATLKPESATALITVEEPNVSKLPVQITVCKEMVVDEEDGQILTFRAYKQKQAEKKVFRHDRIELKDLNTTFVPANGRTDPQKIANALKLKPGRPFCWHGQRWQQITGSGIFSKILKASPIRTSDGGVCLQVYATEPAPRHLEYGLGKSLYTGTWEGEIDFEHQNLFGGGESVGLVVRRGTKDAAPSIRIQYKDDHFGMEGGHEFEVFTDYIGNDQHDTKKDDDKEQVETSAKSKDYDNDSLFNRRGATVRLQNPISPTYIRNTVASISAERTSTRTGLHESLGSTSLTLGPFRQRLPMDARSSLTTTLTGGTRVAEAFSEASAQDSSTSSFSWASGLDLLPYSQISATARQVLPLASISGEMHKPLTLALQHIVSTSTSNLPRHERKAMGISTQIRGAKPDGSATSSIKGTAELRVPFDLGKRFGGDGSVILFGDWFYVQKEHSSPFYAKSSIGVGLRKNVQGLPLKYDASYTSEGNVKQFFGLGLDFDA
jgi:outer membrane protein assembly factor BamA